MFKNKAVDGTNNLLGPVIQRYRAENGLSQRELSDKLLLAGLDIDKNQIQKIEAGTRFITDIELFRIMEILKISFSQLKRDLGLNIGIGEDTYLENKETGRKVIIEQGTRPQGR